MADKWTIAEGINVNRSTKYTDTENKSLDNETYFGQAKDTALKDADTLSVDASNFSGTMSDKAREELVDVESKNVSQTNRANVDDIRFGGTDVNKINPTVTQDEIDTLNDFSESFNMFTKQNSSSLSNFFY